MFLEYSTSGKAYHVFNKASRVIEESINVKYKDNMKDTKNDVAERKNRSLQKMVMTMMIESGVPTYF